MIYGKKPKGNYKKLSSLAQKIRVFTNYNNKKSMIYIDNFYECVKYAIENQIAGFIYPQNNEYVKISDLVKEIALNHNRNLKLINIFAPISKLLMSINIINKIFGDFYYDKSMSSSCNKSAIVNFRDSIKYSEKEDEDV